jgi:hypothetical protein
MAEILRDNNGHALIVFKTGRTLLHAVALYNPPVRVVHLDLAERRHLRPILYRGGAYPVRRALRHFKQAGRTLGITGAARKALRELA